MPLSYRELSQPTVEPVTLDMVKQQLRIDFTDDDALLTGYITAARQHVEKVTQRAIFNRKMRLTLDTFPWPGWDSTTGSTARQYYLDWYYRGLVIRLPKPASVSVESITYVDSNGTVQTINPAKYNVDTTSEPARIAPAPGYTWPYQQNFVPGSIVVNYTAGTYEQEVTDTLSVPATAPYIVALSQGGNLINFTSLMNASGQTVAYTLQNGTLTVNESLAGTILTATYTVNNCPQTIVIAMLLIIGHLYKNRESTTAENLKNLPLGVDELLAGEVFETIYG